MSDQEHFFVFFELDQHVLPMVRSIADVVIEDGSSLPVLTVYDGWQGTDEELRLVDQMKESMSKEVAEWREVILKRLGDSREKGLSDAVAEYETALDLFDQCRFTDAEPHLDRGDHLLYP